MFSECEDDLCIFVCGTCKRYFTQLSAFSQHKKEKLCKKKSPGNVLLKDSTMGQQSTQDTSEENETDDNMADTTGLSETLQFPDVEGDNSQRKYPRKQDKKLIKRTIREQELENQEESLLIAEGKFNPLLSQVPAQDSATGALALSATTSEETQRNCKHPIYVCKTCHAEFPNTNGRVFKCVDCRRGFYTEADLNQHMVRAKHNNLCAVCGKIFPDKYKLRKHELSHVTEKNFRCEEPGCTKSFKSAEDVRTHVRYVHAVEKRFHCTHCTRAFTRLDKFKLHMNTHGISLKAGPFAVNQISGTIKSPGDNPVGVKTSPGDEPHGTLALYNSTPSEAGENVTEVVQTVEVSAGDANSRHSPGHEENAASTEVDVVRKSDSFGAASAIVPYSSSSEFTDSVNYNNTSVDGETEQDGSMDSSAHSQSEHTDGQDCQRCQTCFHSSVEYFAHEERRADHVLRCEHCSGKFLSVCEMRSHVREEHGAHFLPQLEAKPPEPVKKPRKHFCQECGKGFTRPDKLKRHVIIHSPDRPCIPCSCKASHGCSRTFYRNDSMKRHALTHTLDKPYNCDDCGKTFSRPDYLTKHIGHVHKRAFKHLCTLCDYGTREAKRLKIHIRSKHELDPDLFLGTDGAEGSLGPSMANPGETVPAGTSESPENPDFPGEMVPPAREILSPDEEVKPRKAHGNTGEMNSGDVSPGGMKLEQVNPREMNPREMNLREMNPREMNPREMNPGEMVPRDLVQHTGRMNPDIGETNSAVIEPLTSELAPGELHPHNMHRRTRNVSPPAEEMHQTTDDVNEEGYRMEAPGTLASPQGAQSPRDQSPVTRQSVISQDLGVPELRLIPDFQDAGRHTFNEGNRRSSEFLVDQSGRSRFPFSYPPQDMRPPYSMAADFTALGHQSGLTQFPPHQSVFSNVHLQFPGGGGQLQNYERKTPLNSRPVSSQSQFWR